MEVLRRPARIIELPPQKSTLRKKERICRRLVNESRALRQGFTRLAAGPERLHSYSHCGLGGGIARENAASGFGGTREFTPLQLTLSRIDSVLSLHGLRLDQSGLNIAALILREF